jgi:hypothetical protein
LNPLKATLLSATLALSVSAAPVFRNPLPIPIGSDSVRDLLSADFNNDGYPDVLLVHGLVNGGYEVAVSLDNSSGNGTGPFAAPVRSSIPYSTVAALGDVNRDSRIDLLVTDWQTNNIVVMLGAGNGTFTQGPAFTAAYPANSVALADFNGDTLPDAAVSMRDSNGNGVIAVAFGDGAGHFAGAVNTSTFSGGALTPADLNGDGKTDLVNNVFSAQILTGNGDGTFTSKGYLQSQGTTVVADFNHDGKRDLAFAAGTTHDWFVDVALGNGDATFATAVRYAVGYNGVSMSAGDADGDGNPDLLVANTAGSTVSVLRGKADGTFHPAQHFLSGPSTWKLAVGDFDRDGKLDFVTLDYNAELAALSFVRGNGDGTFDTYRAFHTNSVVPVFWPGLELHGCVVADMNRDDKPDVVALQQHSGQLTFDLAVLLNDGTGNLAAPIFTGTAKEKGNWLPSFAIGDLNGDGIPDAVVVDDDGPSAAAFLGDGSGGFGGPLSLPITRYGPPTLAHFDGDTNLDVYIGGNVYPGSGNGTFGPAIYSDAVGGSLLFGDLNGDGKNRLHLYGLGQYPRLRQRRDRTLHRHSGRRKLGDADAGGARRLRRRRQARSARHHGPRDADAIRQRRRHVPRSGLVHRHDGAGLSEGHPEGDGRRRRRRTSRRRVRNERAARQRRRHVPLEEPLPRGPKRCDRVRRHGWQRLTRPGRDEPAGRRHRRPAHAQGRRSDGADHDDTNLRPHDREIHAEHHVHRASDGSGDRRHRKRAVRGRRSSDRSGRRRHHRQGRAVHRRHGRHAHDRGHLYGQR